jgi:FAD/FMN-containing dehydrogenase
VHSVRRLWVLTPDGAVVETSRTDRPELFSHVIGGYGLFGVILEAELSLVPNAAYRFRSDRVPLEALPGAFRDAMAADPPPGLMFARLDIRPDHRFDEALGNRFLPVDRDELPPIEAPAFEELRHTVFLSTIGSDYGKKIRWNIERATLELMQARSFTRNQLLDEPVDTIADHDPGRTQILHEYFVPPDRSLAFLADVERIVTGRGADLLNVTVRDVRRDDVTAMAYARQDVLAFVMLFNQTNDAAGEAAQRDLTRALVDAALAQGGTYYLPYRRHPTPEQLRRAYPGADAFFAAKRAIDPGERFSNGFYETYGRKEGP